MKLVSFASALAITSGWMMGCGDGSGLTPPTSSGFSAGSTTTTGGSSGTAGTDIPTPFSPNFSEPVVVSDPAPPPVSGGTLTVIADGHQAAVADPDQDHVVIVSLDNLQVTKTIDLQPGDEPGRLIEDRAGHVHVSLRRGGAIATLDPASGAVLSRRPVCAYPRGLAYDVKTDSIHVACVGGELVTLPAAGGAATRTVKLENDLRDVVIDGNQLLVSRFRTAELLVVEPDGHVSAKLSPPGRKQPLFDSTMGKAEFTPGVAWRTIQNPGGGAIMVFQEEQTSEVHIEPGGYGGRGCGGGIVQSSVALLRADGSGWATHDLDAVLPVDVALSPGGTQVGVARAGVFSHSFELNPNSLTPVVTFAPGNEPQNDPDGTDGSCASGGGLAFASTDSDAGASNPGGQAVAVAFGPAGQLIVQTREPAMLVVGSRAVNLPGTAHIDSGHELFHMGTRGGVACASCHPEGREDGHVWKFADLGARRTQSIGGGLLGTEPLHWSGDMTDFGVLSHEVLTNRMSGPSLGPEHATALAKWIDHIPAWKPGVAADSAAAARGDALFHDRDVGCATCHAGEKLTNNTTVDVGTGAQFQVPSLRGIAYRAPYMHEGCAKTLGDRFSDACGGGDKHGRTSTLSASQRTDLVAFLNTL